VTEQSFRFAGWFTLDIRLLAALFALCAALAVLVLAVWFKGRRWDEYVVGFVAVFTFAMVATLLLTNLVGGFPAVRIETLFPVP
jgi:membrane protein YdbS with pleckstrin-like domain